MYQGVRLGRIAGVEISADWSLLIIFFLITFGLATGMFPTWHPEWSAGMAWLAAACAAVLFVASVLAHELSHALVGRRAGVIVRRITLFVFGGMAHMESEPPTWRAELRMAIAGPIVSLLIGIACLTWATVRGGAFLAETEAEVLQRLAQFGPATIILLWLGWINIILAVFNLVPGFPLDGGRVLRAIVWGVTGDHRRATRIASLMGQAFAWILIAIGFAMLLGGTVPIFGRGLIGGLWLILMGWFLNNAALRTYQHLLVVDSLDNVPAHRLMRLLHVRLHPGTTLHTVVERDVMASGQSVFPIEEGGRFVGWLRMEEIRRSCPNMRRSIKVADAMTPATELEAVGPEQNANEALFLMDRHRLDHIPVVERGRLLGVLTKEDMAKWLALSRARERRDPFLCPSEPSRG